MDISEPYNTNQPRSRGRGFHTNNRGGGSFAPREVPLGMVIDRTSRLHVTNIPLDVIESEGNEALKSEFAAFGHIDRYVLFSDRTGRFTGGGMCTFRNPADAREAMKALNGRANSDGSTLRVKIAQEHGVVLMKDLKAQERERQEALARGEVLPDPEEGADADAASGLHSGAPKRGYNQDGSWSHDMFDRMQRGEPVRLRGGYRGPETHTSNNGGGRGGGFSRVNNSRGGFYRGGRGGGQTIEDKFEQYIMQRDGLLATPEHHGMVSSDQPIFANAEAHQQHQEQTVPLFSQPPAVAHDIISSYAPPPSETSAVAHNAVSPASPSGDIGVNGFGGDQVAQAHAGSGPSF